MKLAVVGLLSFLNMEEMACDIEDSRLLMLAANDSSSREFVS
jgi:hypothetical protein